MNRLSVAAAVSLLCSISLPAYSADEKLAVSEPASKTGAIEGAVTRVESETPQRLSDVKKIFVDSLGRSDESQVIREKTVSRLLKAGFTVVETAADADATLKGTAIVKESVDVGGYMNVYNGNGYGTVNGGSSYSYIFAVRLVGKKGQVLWTNESRHRLFQHHGSQSGRAADQIVKDLMKALEKDKGQF